MAPSPPPSPARPHGRRGPGQDALAAAAGRPVPDLLLPDLDVLFCGINPGLWSAAVGHHFARPGNRFWKALHGAGFTEELLDPAEEAALLEAGLGVTNLVARSTATAAGLTRGELRAGAARLARTVARSRPRFVAFLGMTAFRQAFDRPRATLGEQPEPLGDARVWLLPNPSGAQARYQLDELVAAFSALRAAARGPEPAGGIPPRARAAPGSPAADQSRTSGL